MEAAHQVGACGCSVGRNVFQSPKPQAVTEALSRIFRDNWSAKKALEELKDKLAH
jgi:DhnA family fructose-bisphosphate aldolase class Ia